MKPWTERAINLLKQTLSSVNIELNDLDWKEKLSPNSERLAEHLSAFSNNTNGGFLVFGVTNDAQILGVTTEETNNIVGKIGSISRNGLSHPISVDHSLLNLEGKEVLLVYIEESQEKPVSKKGAISDCYKRSAAMSVKMSDQEIRLMMANSMGINFERRIAKRGLTDIQILDALEYEEYFALSKKKKPSDNQLILAALQEIGFIRKSSAPSMWDITNLGALLFAKNIHQFGLLRRKAVKVVVYNDNTKNKPAESQDGGKGYAVGFRGLIEYIMERIPKNEIIENALRQNVKMYPEIAIRELVANAIIHQDLSMIGSTVMIHIFSDRIEITNPGVPIMDTNRFIDSNKSRNEEFADLMNRLRICEERGSGIDRVITYVEIHQLPPPKFIKGEDYTKVILYAPKEVNRMGKEDKIRACYQHCALNTVNNMTTNNESVRRRFGIAEKNYPMASRIIADTVESGLIKPLEESTSRKFMSYIPYWA